MSIGATRPSRAEIAQWWDWALSIPDQPPSGHPGKGGDIFQNQNKPFFCHVCTFGTGRDLNRRYMVRPQDVQKQIMVPVLTSEASQAENPNYNDQQLLYKASYDLQSPQVLFLSVDDEFVLTPQNALQYYVESDPFDLKPVAKNILGLPNAQTRMRCLGYFVLLDALSQGRHNITFGGSAGPPNDRIETLVHYEVRV